MDSGSLRHRVTIQTATTVDDDYGKPQKTWNDVGTYWALVQELQGREAVVAQQVQASASIAVTLRGGVAVAPAMRLRFRGRVLSILSVVTDPKGRETTLLCHREE